MGASYVKIGLTASLRLIPDENFVAWRTTRTQPTHDVQIFCLCVWDEIFFQIFPAYYFFFNRLSLPASLNEETNNMPYSQWNRQPDKADLFSWHSSIRFFSSFSSFWWLWDATFSRSHIRRGMLFWLLFILVFVHPLGNVYRLFFFSGLMFCGVFTILAVRHWTASRRGVYVWMSRAVCWHQLAFDECLVDCWEKRGEALPRCVLIASTFCPSFGPMALHRIPLKRSIR